MIKKCNFKTNYPETPYDKKCTLTTIAREDCLGEENCILFQIYQRLGKDWGWEERE